MADSTALRFQQPAQPPGPLALRFGATGGLAPGEVAARLHGRITRGLHGHVGAAILVQASAHGRITGLRGHVGAAWDSNTDRPERVPVAAHWQHSQGRAAATTDAWQRAKATGVAHSDRWQPARHAAAVSADHWQATQRRVAGTQDRWQPAQGRAAVTTDAYQQALRYVANRIDHFQDARPQGVQHAHAYQQALRYVASGIGHFQDAHAAHAASASRFHQRALHRLAQGTDRYQDARRPPPGTTPRPGQPPAQPICYDPAAPLHLRFIDLAHPAGPLHLRFACHRWTGGGDVDPPPATVIVLPRRSYLVINSIELRRADDLSGPPLPSEAFGMTLDADSWTWSWSATFGRAARDAVAPGPDGAPVEIEARVNGQPFRLQAERIGRSVRFPERLVKVSGRGKAALLDAPHAAVQSFGNTAARSAHQLMQDVLTINGVGIGWTVDWGLTDWPVPAGVWTHQGTWASALNDIAGAAGGYVQPHDTAATLRVLPRWPKPWWEWASATPDIELPAGIAEVEETEWIDKPAYDRVIVHGALGGVRGNFKRAGTAGEVLRPMVVHPLITHADVVRQRAIAELSDSGRLINQTLTLMVLPETGVIKPGTLLRYTDDDGAPRLGLVRSTGINWSFPVLTQTIGVEGHA